MPKQQHSVDRGLGLDLAVTFLATMGKPELKKLLAKIGAKGKDIAGPLILAINEETGIWLKKNKVK